MIVSAAGCRFYHAQNLICPVIMPKNSPTTPSTAMPMGRPVSTASAIAMSLPFVCSPKSVTASSDTDRACNRRSKEKKPEKQI